MLRFHGYTDCDGFRYRDGLGLREGQPFGRDNVGYRDKKPVILRHTCGRSRGQKLVPDFHHF